jgi:tetratricopeptide (TPR) repeat protein
MFRSALLRSAFAVVLGLASISAFANDLVDIQKLMKEARYEEALTKTQAWLAAHPGDAQGRFLKGLIQTELNQTDAAIATFSALAADHPELPEPYNNLAVLYAQKKQYDSARKALEMAIRTHPAYAVAYENLGDVYARLASQAYDKALKYDSSNAAAQKKLSLIKNLGAVAIPPGPSPQQPPVAMVETPQAPPMPPVQPVQTAPVQTAALPAQPMQPAQPAQAQAQTPVPQPLQPASPPVQTAMAAPPAPPAYAAAPPAEQQAITQLVHDWAAAWSRRDVPAYLAFYGEEFRPARGKGRKAWEDERQARLTAPSWIKVETNNLSIGVSGDVAEAQFRQLYSASSGFKSNVVKTLRLKQEKGQWKIVEESSR